MRLRLILGELVLVGILSAQVIEPPQAPVPLVPAVPPGAEILGKGPIHEGYARPADDRPMPAPLIQREPPALVEELPPDQRPEGSAWIPGYWQFDDDRNDFIWISGFWRVPPPNRQWVPGQYQRAEGGWRWVPGFWAAVQARDLTYLPPPPASLEVGPALPAPQDDAIYVPGCWVYHDTAYRWRAGFWTAHRPGWVWSPAQYHWTPAGHVFVDGYWDAPLERRGCLFAPVVFEARVLRPGFVWTPSYVVTHEFLPSAMFVRPACGHYYFGDYYSPRCAERGYSFWFDYRYGRSCPDPIYSYYRVTHRERTWEREVRTVYVERQRGIQPPPPPTLTAQLAPPVPNVGPRLSPPPVQSPPPLAPFSAKSAGQGLTLAKVAAPEREAIVRNTAEVRALSAQRTALEKPVANAGPPKANDAPRALGLKLASTPPDVKPPPSPPAGVPRTVSVPPPETKISKPAVTPKPVTPPIVSAPPPTPPPAPLVKTPGPMTPTPPRGGSPTPNKPPALINGPVKSAPGPMQEKKDSEKPKR